MSQKGSAVVEFALVVPMVLALILGLVEVALVARTQLEVVNAAREGARQAAASPDPADAVNAARNALGGNGASARVSVRRPDV
ncbi:MAG: TadE family protein, partial [Acidimicrobiia bacterium]